MNRIERDKWGTLQLTYTGERMFPDQYNLSALEDRAAACLDRLSSDDLAELIGGDDLLTRLARAVLMSRGMDQNGKWVGFERAYYLHGAEVGATVPDDDDDEPGPILGVDVEPMRIEAPAPTAFELLGDSAEKPAPAPRVREFRAGFTPTEHIGTCSGCGRQFVISREAIEDATHLPADALADEADPAEFIDWCLACVTGEPHPEEEVR